MRAVKFDAFYKYILTHALDSEEEINVRTGSRVRTIRGGTSFLLDISDYKLQTAGIRRTFPKSAAAEVAWYLQGSRDVRWISKYAPMWDKFVESDGQTVSRAYGYRWRYHFGRDQINNAIMTLIADPSNRRVNISAWDPSDDGLLSQGQKNVPCPTNFTLSILNGELHSSLFLRSSDLFVGLPYDVMGHILLVNAFARSLSIKPGTIHFTLANAHLYGQHEEYAVYAVNHRSEVPTLYIPPWTITGISNHPDEYVKSIANASAKCIWPQFNPKPEVIP